MVNSHVTDMELESHRKFLKLSKLKELLNSHSLVLPQRALPKQSEATPENKGSDPAGCYKFGFKKPACSCETNQLSLCLETGWPCSHSALGS